MYRCFYLKNYPNKALGSSFQTLLCSEGQETGAIAPAPENARKKI
jgi:hypothetical protein